MIKPEPLLVRRIIISAICVILFAGRLISPAAAQTTVSPANAPPTWAQFAKLVKYHFEEGLSSNDPISARFRVYLKAQAGASDGPPDTLTVAVWIRPDGTVDRVSFPPFGDAGATKDLTKILTGAKIGEAPPPDLAQPIRLRFKLTPK
jgi:hypothetical protein